jgi:hypothetical protein
LLRNRKLRIKGFFLETFNPAIIEAEFDKMNQSIQVAP